jgi:hypothetical protein
MVAMKEYPNPNYSLKIHYLKDESDPEVSTHTESGWLLIVNYVVNVVFMPYVPLAPWPPPVPSDLEHAQNRDEAALVTLSMNTQIVTPSPDGSERQEDLAHPIHGTQTFFFVTKEHYAALDEELLALRERPQLPGSYEPLRLSELGEGALREFLTRDLPRSAELSKYDRDILCLGPLHEYL